MTSTPAKLRLKLAWIEVDYEGNSDFLEDKLLSLLEQVSRLSAEHPNAITPKRGAHTEPEKSPSREGILAHENKHEVEHTTSSIASLLSAETGSELIVAAAAKLSFMDKRDRFSRQDLLTEMRTAAGYFKETYSSNLTSYIRTLEKANRLRQGGKNSYSLSPSERSALNGRLSENS